MHDQPHLTFQEDRVVPIEDRWERMVAGDFGPVRWAQAAPPAAARRSISSTISLMIRLTSKSFGV